MKINRKNLRRSIFAATTATALALGMLAPVAAYADDSLSADDIVSAITNSAPDVLENVADVTTSDTASDSVAATIESIAVTVPEDPSRGITLDPKSGPTIGVGLPFAGTADDSTVIADGVVAYDNNNGSATVPVVKEDGSVQITTIIADANAPTRYDYSLTLPAGGIALVTDEGGVVLVDIDGNFIGGFASAWAKDATGTAVATHYEVSGSVLTQVVDHQVDNVVYPVVADPWYGITLIDRVKWVNDNGYSPTLQVYPTSWGRTTGYLARWAAWDEVVKKGGSAANKQNMADQFYCHWDVVRIVSPNKTSWNLDSKRPNVGYWATVQANCNAT